MNKQKIVTLLAEIKLCFGNGSAYFSDFKYPLIIAGYISLKFPHLTIKFLVPATIGMLLFMIFLGWFDFNYIQLHQTEAKLSTEKYNPYFSELKREVGKN